MSNNKQQALRNLGQLIQKNAWIPGLIAGIFGIFALRLPPFALFGAAIVALVSLRESPFRAIQAMLLATALVGVAWYGLGSRPGLAFPLVYALWPPVIMMATVLRRTGSQGAALLIAGAAMLVYVLLMHIFAGDVVTFWQSWLQRAISSIPGSGFKGFNEDGFLRIINGFVALLYGLSLFISLLLGRWLQSVASQSGHFALEFRQLTLPLWVLPLSVTLIWAGGLWDASLLADLLVIAILLYFFVGLAVIHGVIAVREMSWYWLIPVYLLIFTAPPQALAALAMVGAIDSFVHFRIQQGRS